ncbi:hypothetical protein ANN_02719 [Periplaneta americana]|uniref:Uncharacterized protein n=1 Tax=Periplaneta americana TaxID=6978 RepID=A0ABQ8TX96_PERAM|nr:hypothetical protein ANN_02719 [Periplaneta americana]
MAGLCEGGNELTGSLKAILKCFVWSAALYGALRRSEEKRLEVFEIWIRMERVKCTGRIGNEAMLERMMMKLIRKRRSNWLGH